MSKRKDWKVETEIAQALGWLENSYKGVVPAIYPSTTFERSEDGSYPNGRTYSRDHNPTFDQAEQLLTRLEGGIESLLFSSGMSAALAVFQALEPGDHVIAPKVMYWSLRNWLLTKGAKWGIETSFVENGNEAALKAAVRPGKTRLLWLETPANPTWIQDDISVWADVAHGCGAKLAVDNTVATPLITRPIAHGADIVMHSATKYLNGHSDVLAGTLTTAATGTFWQEIRQNRASGGAVMGPMEAWLLLRGMRTLSVRVKQASHNAMAIAIHFENHPGIRDVLYPGLTSSAQYKLAQKQMTGGFGGMLSICPKGGESVAMKVAANMKLFKRATSLGGVESLVEHRASIEGEGTPCPPDLLRLSVGLEDKDDLIEDIEQALSAVQE
jgi:cystathionine gamma-synthase